MISMIVMFLALVGVMRSHVSAVKIDFFPGEPSGKSFLVRGQVGLFGWG